LERAVIFLNGQDPITAQGGGSSYVRTHSRASLMAGLETHIFCVSNKDEVVVTDFGTVHRVATPARLRGPLFVERWESPERIIAHWAGALINTSNMSLMHGGALTKSIERFMLDAPKSYIVHSFSCWGAVGLKVRKRMKNHGMIIPVVNSSYTTALHEMNGKLAWIRQFGSPGLRFLYRCEYLWISLMSSRWERTAVTESQMITVNYESVRKLIQEEFDQNLAIRKLPYSPESAFLRPENTTLLSHPELGIIDETAAPPLIISVSRHDPRKGLETFIRSLASLRHKGVAFRAKLASGGPLFQFHQQLLEELDLADDVVLLGWIDDPLELMEQADIFVLPSLEEGSGSLSMLEAMQSGLAIVASNIDGIPEDVTDGLEGLLVEPENVSALSDALEKLLVDNELLDQFKLRAEERFKRCFSAEPFSLALKGAYEEVWGEATNND
jgi:glycosyltransferase involved in cell wall biosynthesis